MAKMYEAQAFGKATPDGKFEKMTIKRGITGPDDVEFAIKYCGICHTDVHFADDTTGMARFPIVPGHELSGIVTKVGQNVVGYKIGDKVGVGCLVDSCFNCEACKNGDEVGCVKGCTNTYNDETKHGRISTDSGYTFGGYSNKISVHHHFVIKIPTNYPLESAGPILCSGITMYTPLKQYGADKGGKRVGVIGVGGLGQMGIRLAKAMGNEVTAISTSPHKESMAKEIGASHFVVSKDPESMAKAAKSLDIILNTISADHQATFYFPLLARRGTLVQIGLCMPPHEIPQLMLMFGQIGIAGSLIGGIPDTQEVIDFCAKRNIVPAIDIVTWDQLDEVYEKLRGSNDRVVRYVLDIDASVKKL